MKRKITIFLLFFSLKLFSANIDIKIGFDGFIIQNCWNPVIINFEKQLKEVSIEIEKIPFDISELNEKEIFNLKNIQTIESSFFYNDNIKEIKISIYSDKIKLLEYKYYLPDKTTAAGIIIAYNLKNEISERFAKRLFPNEKTTIINFQDKELFNFALNYSGIKTVFLNYENLNITIGQKNALKAAISQGKNIFITNTVGYKNILDIPVSEKNKLQIEYGLGNLFLIDDIIIPNYLSAVSDKNLSINFFNIIKNNNPDIKNHRKQFYIILLFSMIWVLTNIFIIIFIKKSKILFFLLMNAVFIIASIYTGNEIAKTFHKGINISATVIAFYDNENIFYNMKFEKSKDKITRYPFDQKSISNGISFNIQDNFSGNILPKKNIFSIEQNSNYIKGSLKNDLPDNFEITGNEKINENWIYFFKKLIDNESVAPLIDSNKTDILSNFYMFYNNKFFKKNFNNGKISWDEMKDILPASQNYKNIFEYFYEHYKNKKIYFYFGDASFFRIKVDNVFFNKFFLIIIR